MFGARNWNHLRRDITRKVRKDFGWVSKDDLDDAVSTAIMNLYVVWKDYEGTKRVGDPVRLYAYALMWGTGRAKQYIVQSLDRQSHELYFDAPPPSSEDGFDSYWDSLPDPSPSPEDLVVSAEEEILLAEIITSLPDRERSSWAEPVMTGETEREQAKRQGVRQQSVHERRQRGYARMRVVFEAKGYLRAVA